MPFTLRQLEALCAVARLGSFQKAADQLRLTQPTVSLRIRELERALNMPLFTRSGRAARLTLAGTGILRQAERLLGLAGEIEAQAGSRDRLSGVLRLGVPESFAIVCLPALLKHLSRHHPRLGVELTVEISPALFRLLHEGRLDVAIVGNPAVDDRLRAEPLGLHELSWVASPRLGLHRRPVRAIDLARYPLLSNPPPAPILRVTMDWFLSAGVQPLRVSTCNSNTAMVRLAANGLGIAVLPPILCHAELAAGLLRPIRVRPRFPLVTMAAVFVAGDDGPAVRAGIAAIRHVVTATKYLKPLRDTAPSSRQAGA